ncbi:hypothetical protein [Blastococcus sp. Marseille-P5729]|uniref:hypothetical protein n=1 Tax=Blastococcus sp. Marseille-P5729 TaxID=2086582 RepID=UPI00131AB2D5|nr:hypothetical protein [Blastococcus sp. Marseille-P5729]
MMPRRHRGMKTAAIIATGATVAAALYIWWVLGRSGVGSSARFDSLFAARWTPWLPAAALVLLALTLLAWAALLSAGATRRITVAFAALSLVAGVPAIALLIPDERRVAVEHWSCSLETFVQSREDLAHCTSRSSTRHSHALVAERRDSEPIDTFESGSALDLPSGAFPVVAQLSADRAARSVFVYEQDGEDFRLATTFSAMTNRPMGERSWEREIEVRAGTSTWHIVEYVSANPPVESASISFTMLDCDGQIPDSLDPDACRVVENPWTVQFSNTLHPARQPEAWDDGRAAVFTNLEATTYTFWIGLPTEELNPAPDGATILVLREELSDPASAALVLATADEEATESRVDVQVEDGSGEQRFRVYVFPGHQQVEPPEPGTGGSG